MSSRFRTHSLNSSHNQGTTRGRSITAITAGTTGHSASKCWAPGGGSARQAPWRNSHIQSLSAHAQSNSHSPPIPVHQTAPQPSRPQITAQTQIVAQAPEDHLFVAKVIEATSTASRPIFSSLTTKTLSAMEDKAHFWLANTATSSHLCGNINLFQCLHDSPTVNIQTASEDIFTATQRGMIHIKIISDPKYELPDVNVTLTDVIFVPKL